MEYTYIVRNRRQLVGTEYRYPGDLIPEAAEFRNLRMYIENGWIERLASDDPEVLAALKRAKPAAPPKPEPVKPEPKSEPEPEPQQAAPVNEDPAGLDGLAAAMAQEASRRIDSKSRRRE